jgi:hypothetical protein
MRQLFLFVSLAVVGFGVYLKYLYDVPDTQETINFFVSGFLIIVGIGSLLVNLFWKSSPSPKKPQE